jgi:hypothetical protein
MKELPHIMDNIIISVHERKDSFCFIFEFKGFL